MEIIIQLLIIFISFLGLPFGLLLARISPEEIEKGKRYFRLIRSFAFVFIAFILFYSLDINLFVNMLITSLLFIFLIFYRIENPIIFYAILPFSVFFSENTRIFAIQSSLIWLFGMASGSFFAKVKNKKFILSGKEILQVLIQNSVFLFISYFLFLIK